MYSVVLMMAVTTGADAPDCHKHHHHSSCHGGGYVASGSGGCYGGGYGGGCSGGYYPGGYQGKPSGEPLKMPGDKKEDIKKPVGSAGAAATIVVSLPKDASLTIDDYTSPACSDTHIIVSSPLGAEDTRTYVLKIQAMRDGKMQTAEERITVRGGEEKRVTLDLPTSVAAR